jgi:hypothetical protein
MLASSSGKVDLVVAGGKISKLMMEKAGLHLWEILDYVRGSFARPVVAVDKSRGAVRALGLVNPLLALIPLIDAGPGKDSDCGALVRDAKSVSQATGKKP